MKILVTTDGSPRSAAVFPHAANLARAINAELLLLRVLNPLTDCADVLSPQLGDAVRTVAARWTDELTTTLAGLNVKGSVLVEVLRLREHVDEVIRKMASEHDAGLLAMSSRGSGIVRHALFGSVALNLVGKLRVPVLVAGAHIESPAVRDPYHIVVTTDGSEDAGHAVDAIVPLAVNDAVRVTLLRIHAPHQGDRGDAAEVALATESLEKLRAKFPDPAAVATVVRSIVRGGGVDTAILAAAAEAGASVVAISTYGHNRSYHTFVGSTAMGVLSHSTLPLLLVRSAPTKAPKAS